MGRCSVLQISTVLRIVEFTFRFFFLYFVIDFNNLDVVKFLGKIPDSARMLLIGVERNAPKDSRIDAYMIRLI